MAVSGNSFWTPPLSQIVLRAGRRRRRTFTVRALTTGSSSPLDLIGVVATTTDRAVDHGFVVRFLDLRHAGSGRGLLTAQAVGL